MGEIRLAKFLGEKIPKEWGYDKDGKPTDDPEEFVAFKPMAKYKGYGLGLAIEILAGTLVRAKMGSENNDKLKRGFLFIIIDPGKTNDPETEKQKIKKFFDFVKSSRKEEWCEEILIPGERSDRKKQKNLKNGYVEVDERIWNRFEEMIE